MDPVHVLSGGDDEEKSSVPRNLPSDLPKSLDDRQPVRSYGGETEMYDAWQGRVRASRRASELSAANTMSVG